MSRPTYGGHAVARESARPVLTNFARINEALPNNEGFSDLDSIYEKNGYFLVLEWKTVDSSIPKGQLILLRRLAMISRFTVYLITGNRQSGEIYGYQRVLPRELTDLRECSSEEFKDNIRAWREDILRRSRA